MLWAITLIATPSKTSNKKFIRVTSLLAEDFSQKEDSTCIIPKN